MAVLGCGGLGVNVAGELAYHGHEVRVFDAAAEALDRVQPRLAEDRKVLRECGLLQQPGLVGSVYCMSRLEDAVRVSLPALVCRSWTGSPSECLEHVSGRCVSIYM